MLKSRPLVTVTVVGQIESVEYASVSEELSESDDSSIIIFLVFLGFLTTSFFILGTDFFFF